MKQLEVTFTKINLIYHKAEKEFTAFIYVGSRVSMKRHFKIKQLMFDNDILSDPGVRN
ncbi:hypothetical protein BH10BAC5_BH10BAC5_27680 [soil metagenome]